ncbi:MAG: hypothetical protein AVDCRST_MAG11-2987 [uncultured Gemmatimonadaceae bacterium]|uniref:HTH arsR-type domain-containing protein n=1 Tax=uncultured Gemmatimonadaceae bacterium TaxID=246130 RepID=A0A6J4LTE6_9BACT|nr:MAG: hypothetical protein AVDCRST_MAG11-2987 [uncultured Gemmatimonadaceae bacterium]
MKPDRDITDPQVAKALAHPLRVRILALLDERTASPSELAQELDADLSVVSYHVRTLARMGFLKLVSTKRRRATVETFYRAADREAVAGGAWAQMPAIVQQAMVGAALGQIAERVNAAAAAGGFERDDAHASRSPVTLDAAGFAEVSGKMDELRSELERIARESGERLAAGGDAGQPVPATAVMLLFESARAGG